MTPYIVKNKTTGESIPVPCGKCPDCLKRRISGWSFRLMQEGKNSSSAYFLTLTYDTAYVPITEKGFMSLQKRDVQLFMKRLRKVSTEKLKYYACGEYGGRTMRPHYHIILFNADITKVQPAWQLGQIHYGDVTGASIGYTLKYMSKPAKIPMHKNDDRLREFSLMSKGLGQNYVTDKICDWHKADLDNRMYCNIDDGKKIAMPRYYKQKVYRHIAAQQMPADLPDDEKQLWIELREKSLRARIAHFSLQKNSILLLKKERKMYEEHGENASAVQVSIDKRKFQKLHLDAEQGRNKI